MAYSLHSVQEINKALAFVIALSFASFSHFPKRSLTLASHPPPQRCGKPDLARVPVSPAYAVRLALNLFKRYLQVSNQSSSWQFKRWNAGRLLWRYKCSTHAHNLYAWRNFVSAPTRCFTRAVSWFRRIQKSNPYWIMKSCLFPQQWLQRHVRTTKLYEIMRFHTRIIVHLVLSVC